MKNKLLRDAVNEDLLIDLLTTLPVNKFNEKRNFISVILLYITGCRINKLIKTGSIMIHSYKTSTTRRIDISESEQLLLIKYEHIINDIYSVLNPMDHLLMTSKRKELSNSNAYILLNRILKKYGDKNGLTILSHSFRIGYITELLKTYNVQIAKSIIGHKQLDTTLRYDRNLLTSNEVKSIRNNLNSNKTLIKYLGQ